MGLFSAIKKGLSKTRESILNEFKTIVGGGELTEAMLEELEEKLIRADVGVEVAFLLTDTLRENALGKAVNSHDVRKMLCEVAGNLLPDTKPTPINSDLHVILIVGVNGAGKTTTIGKLAEYYRKSGKKVLIAAADTFRAAAIEQLEAWAQRSQAEFVHHQEGSDPAAVAYDAWNAAKSRGCDILIVDTAGRLHNKTHLMEELAKIVRVLQKNAPDIPHETCLVIDGNTGQNTIAQTKSFNQLFPLSSLIITKLDGTSKGGSVLGISRELGLPISWLGMGEGIGDLVPFNKDEYINGLFGEDLTE
jgi:fused signal recognition particle receptor